MALSGGGKRIIVAQRRTAVLIKGRGKRKRSGGKTIVQKGGNTSPFSLGKKDPYWERELKGENIQSLIKKHGKKGVLRK